MKERLCLTDDDGPFFIRCTVRMIREWQPLKSIVGRFWEGKITLLEASKSCFLMIRKGATEMAFHRIKWVNYPLESASVEKRGFQSRFKTHSGLCSRDYLYNQESNHVTTHSAHVIVESEFLAALISNSDLYKVCHFCENV